jgi:allantoin racemase
LKSFEAPIRVRVVNAVVPGIYSDDALPPLPGFVRGEVDWLESGPSVIECLEDDARCVPPLLDRVRAAATDGADGIVINCFMDPGLHAARELVHLPVAALAESAMTLAVTLGQTFSVVLPAASGGPKVTDQARLYVGADRLASVRGVEVPVADLSDHERLIRQLGEQAELAITKDAAQVVILGCSGMSAVAAAVKQGIAERGYDVPVIDPTLAAVMSVVAQHTLGVHHSGYAFPLPSWKLADAAPTR